jgi:hypothetical protein
MAKPSIRPKDPNDLITAAPKWFRGDGEVPLSGVGLFAGKYLVQILTPGQALNLANQLADSYQIATKDNPNG